jgi:hypothetical protein
MDWKAVAGLAAPFAPTIGKILGGLIPVPGGALLGEWAGSALARALGVPATPEAVGGAIQGMPAGEVEERLAAVENEAVAKWEAWAKVEEAQAADRTAQSREINQTIREEAPRVPWWHWRHLLGYVLVILGAETAALVPLVVFGKITAADMVAILTALMPITGIFAALNGYIAQDNTKRLTTAITGEHPPSMTDTVASAVKKAITPTKPTVIIGKPVGSRD